MADMAPQSNEEERLGFNPLLALIPLPGCEDPLGEEGELTPAWAERWLREDFADWAKCAEHGYELEDAEMRQAFRALASDLALVTELSLYVLRTGKAHPVERHDEGMHVETALARIVAGRSVAEGSGGFENAFDALAAFLAARLAAREARAS